jgi:hypothetical protein
MRMCAPAYFISCSCGMVLPTSGTEIMFFFASSMPFWMALTLLPIILMRQSLLTIMRSREEGF